MKKKTNLLITACLLLNFSVTTFSQNRVIISDEGGSEAHESAILELKSTDKGFLLPRMNTDSRNNIDQPSESLLIYNNQTKCVETFIDSEWHEVWCDEESEPEPLECPEIGDEFGGGVVFYILQDGDPGYVPGVCHAFISETEDQSSGIQFGCPGTRVNTTSTDLGAGSSNTADIVADCDDASFAAKLCDEHVSGGYSDWFLPSAYELTQLCFNRAVVEAVGDDFYEDGHDYYCSTEPNTGNGTRYKDFENCDPGQDTVCITFGDGCKGDEHRVRCIREVIIEP